MRGARARGAAAEDARSARQAQLDDAQTAVDQTKAAVAGADAQIASAKANIGVLEAQYAEAAEHAAHAASSPATRRQRDLSFTVLRAPYDGVVGNLSVEQGDLISAGQKLAVIVPMDKLYIVANFKETQLARLVPGEKVRISVDAPSDQRFRRHGVVAGAGFRRGVLAAAAGKRDRQLHQGRAARAGAHRRAGGRAEDRQAARRPVGRRRRRQPHRAGRASN